MALVLNGTTGVSGIDGSAGTPSLQGSDTNTGFFYGSDILGFSTGGSERMRLDSSGNLGLGVTPSAWSANKALQIGSGTVLYDAGGIPVLACNYYYNGGDKYIANGYSSRYYQASGAHIWQTAPSGTAGNAISFTQAMTLAATGNLGIGSASPPDPLTVVPNGTGSNLGVNLVNNSSNLSGIGFGTYSAPNSSWTFIRGDGRASGYISMSTNDTERMRIDSSGNVGIGTSSPAVKLDVNGAVRLADAYELQWGGTTATIYGSSASNQLRMYTNNTERMRIDSSGNLLVGGTSTLNAEKLSVQTVDANACAFTNTSATGYYTIEVRNKATTGDRRLIRFMAGSTPTDCGAIYYDGSSTVYATSSDYRLKENVTDLPNGLDAVLKLKPRSFTWKDGQIDDTGFIAHELQEVFPKAVQGEKDAVDAEGNPVYQGIDTSFLVATLTKAIQELKAEIDELKAKVN